MQSTTDARIEHSAEWAQIESEAEKRNVVLLHRNSLLCCKKELLTRSASLPLKPFFPFFPDQTKFNSSRAKYAERFVQ